MPEKDITPSVILITGAGKGIGRAVAEGLAARARQSGAQVRLMLAARTQADLEALGAQLQGGGLSDAQASPATSRMPRCGRSRPASGGMAASMR